MSKTGPILLIEDDIDDINVFKDALNALGYNNQLIWYDNADDAMEYLESTDDSVFIVFSDINLPGMNGLEFKKKIDSVPHLRIKSIPFVFYSTSARQQDIDKAYSEMTIQGFFKK